MIDELNDELETDWQFKRQQEELVKQRRRNMKKAKRLNSTTISLLSSRFIDDESSVGQTFSLALGSLKQS